MDTVSLYQVLAFMLLFVVQSSQAFDGGDAIALIFGLILRPNQRISYYNLNVNHFVLLSETTKDFKIMLKEIASRKQTARLHKINLRLFNTEFNLEDFFQNI
ncbi:hypothetical protein BpHYR1_037698 [Brachionus plicatilis]|uniref:Uncharacterized protein n=1 Tax=Brachionus plicatilis TaxID=10195 RepID=A0A3M7P7F5_BRAPC|nr:hypothetical protein BpHYR1_037698 [Brachionus plicatilis]